jgi:hypothetical protein
VVIVNPGFNVDDHHDWIPDMGNRVITIEDSMTPSTNLAQQSAVIGNARAFVGTYGGYAYLAPLYRVPAVAFYSKPTFKLQHLHVAQRVFTAISAAPLISVNVRDLPVVQLALAAAAPA